MEKGDHEYLAFEKFAEQHDLDRNQHPMFLLYPDAKTADALKAFKAGYLAGQELIAKQIHYPDCWDTIAYPDPESAAREIGCNPKNCVK